MQANWALYCDNWDCLNHASIPTAARWRSATRWARVARGLWAHFCVSSRAPTAAGASPRYAWAAAWGRRWCSSARHGGVPDRSPYAGPIRGYPTAPPARPCPPVDPLKFPIAPCRPVRIRAPPPIQFAPITAAPIERASDPAEAPCLISRTMPWTPSAGGRLRLGSWPPLVQSRLAPRRVGITGSFEILSKLAASGVETAYHWESQSSPLSPPHLVPNTQECPPLGGAISPCRDEYSLANFTSRTSRGCRAALVVN